ncbi:MAG: IS1595 family transposase [Solobacterium sp.]|nr:IS1595 family transposase [Solobacterium sp.]
MSVQNSFTDLVFSLSDEDFRLLQDAVAVRKNRDKYGVASFEELAVKYDRVPTCPACGSDNAVSFGFSPEGLQRYKCLGCGKYYTLLSNTIFHSANKSFDTWTIYLTLMTFNVPLEMTEEICGISHPTAMLWRQKVFATVDGYQGHLYLKDRVWIDETYVFDSTLLHDDNFKRKRGLSSNLICIVVAIDIHKNTYAVICGHGKPSATRIYKALKDHIVEGSTLVHDGEKAHNMLIEKLDLTSEVYIANAKDKNYLQNMALINNMCSWLKRYIYRFIGMRMENLQSYLNWFVYLFRVKGAAERWPKMERILRHLVLTDVQYKRNR